MRVSDLIIPPSELVVSLSRSSINYYDYYYYYHYYVVYHYYHY